MNMLKISKVTYFLLLLFISSCENVNNDKKINNNKETNNFPTSLKEEKNGIFSLHMKNPLVLLAISSQYKNEKLKSPPQDYNTAIDVFKNYFKYDCFKIGSNNKIVKSDLDNWIFKINKMKNHKYDGLIFVYSGHGSGGLINVYDGDYSYKKIVNGFKNFEYLPQVFFKLSCRKNISAFPINESTGIKVLVYSCSEDVNYYDVMDVGFYFFCMGIKKVHNDTCLIRMLLALTKELESYAKKDIDAKFSKYSKEFREYLYNKIKKGCILSCKAKPIYIYMDKKQH